jgi:hypothetical protein
MSATSLDSFGFDGAQDLYQKYMGTFGDQETAAIGGRFRRETR